MCSCQQLLHNHTHPMRGDLCTESGPPKGRGFQYPDMSRGLSRSGPRILLLLLSSARGFRPCMPFVFLEDGHGLQGETKTSLCRRLGPIDPIFSDPIRPCFGVHRVFLLLRSHLNQLETFEPLPGAGTTVTTAAVVVSKKRHG